MDANRDARQPPRRLLKEERLAALQQQLREIHALVDAHDVRGVVKVLATAQGQGDRLVNMRDDIGDTTLHRAARCLSTPRTQNRSSYKVSKPPALLRPRWGQWRFASF